MSLLLLAQQIRDESFQMSPNCSAEWSGAKRPQGRELSEIEHQCAEAEAEAGR